MIIDLCDRWHKTPDEILAMDIEALQLLKIVHLGRREERNGKRGVNSGVGP